MSFLSGLLGVSVSEKRRSMIRVICITAAIVIAISLILTVTLISDRSSKKEDPDDKDSAVNEITESFEFSDTKTGTLLLVNKSTDGFDFSLNPESKLVSISENIAKADGAPIYALRNENMKAHPEALKALNKMMTDFYTQDADAAKKLTVRTAYRSLADQQALSSSVKGGYSDFHTGMLFELCVEQTAVSISTDSSFAWIYENAANYGFIERYPEAKSSITGVSDFDNAFRYVGEAHAKYISANKLSLEEYVELIKSNGANPTDIGGYKVKRIEIPHGETIEVSIPSRATLSGDNVGGIIITYK